MADRVLVVDDEQSLRKVLAATLQRAGYEGNVVPDEGALRTEIVGKGQQMIELQQIIAKVSDAPSTVLIQGESGTGKELVATALHEKSSRREKPFIKINCAAIPRELVEAELFGFEKGAFTGAVQSKPGRFELADGGTLFLDEIGEIPLEMQVKLLRAIQESEFERVGGVRTTKVQVRLIAATSRDLMKEIAAGRFREDLFYRLNVVPIRLPPLRERRDDIPLMVRHFLTRYNTRLNKSIDRVDDDALAVLSAYSWPGNIRELENVLERTILFAEGPVIRASDLPPSLRQQPSPESAQSSVAGLAPGSLKEIVKGQVQAIERDLIVRGLEVTGGNVTRTAKLLKISRKSLQMKTKEFGLRGEDQA